MSNKLEKLKSINESLTVNRYDNGYMVEASGQCHMGDWKTVKVICNTEEELLAVIKEANRMELN